MRRRWSPMGDRCQPIISTPIIPGDLEHLLGELHEAIARHSICDRFGRAEPRANKRRHKPQKFLTMPRCQARIRLLKKVQQESERPLTQALYLRKYMATHD